jgi:hypothetical protein
MQLLCLIDKTAKKPTRNLLVPDQKSLQELILEIVAAGKIYPPSKLKSSEIFSKPLPNLTKPPLDAKIWERERWVPAKMAYLNLDELPQAYSRPS